MQRIVATGLARPLRGAAGLLLIGIIVQFVVLLPTQRSLWTQSLALFGWTALIAVPTSGIIAVLIVRMASPAGRLVLPLLVAATAVPLYAHVAGWDAAWGSPAGWIVRRGEVELWRGLAAAAWVHALAAIPWCTAFLVWGLRAVAPAAEEQLLLDQPAPWVLVRSTLPQLELALGASLLWILATTLSDIAATDYFQVRTFSEELYLGFATEPETLGIVRRMLPSISTLSLAVGLLWLSWTSRVGRSDEPTGGRSGTAWNVPQRTFAKVFATAALACVATCVIIVPVGQLGYQAGLEVRPLPVGREFSWSIVRLAQRLGEAVRQTRGELALSLLLSQFVAATCVTVAGPAVWWCYRGVWRQAAWVALLAVAVSVPAPVLAIGLIHGLNQPGHALLNWLYDRTLFPLWLVHVVRCLPWAALVLGLAARSVPDALRDTAQLDGRRGIWQYLSVGLPMTFSHHLAAWLLVSALSLGELTASILVTPPGYTTLAVEFFSQLHYGTRYEVAALCLLVWIATIALGGLGVLNGWYGPQRLGRTAG